MPCQRGGLPGVCSETVHGVSNKTVQSGHGGADKERAVGSPSPEVLQNCGDAALRDVWMGWGWTWGFERFFFPPLSLNDSMCKNIEAWPFGQLQVSRPRAPWMGESGY